MKRHAHSLIELLLVLGIISLLAGLLIRGLHRAKVRACAVAFSARVWRDNQIDAAMEYDQRNTGLETLLTTPMPIVKWSHR